MEAEEPTKKLVDALVIVRPASIPRWNEHKDVKEDKEREPHVFIPHHRTSEVDAEAEPTNVERKESALPADPYTTGLLLNMAVRGFKKPDLAPPGPLSPFSPKKEGAFFS